MWQEKQPDEFFLSTFRQSLKNGDIGMIEFLASKPPHISNFNQIEWSCLHTIAYVVHPATMRGLYATATLEQVFSKNKKSLDKFSKYGNLPIHLACQTNNVSILKIIIETAQQQLKEYLANMLNKPTKDKYRHNTPLIIAIKNNSVDCVKLLCQYDCVGKNILKYKSRYPNYNALEFACYYNNIDILKPLLSSIVKNNDKDELNLIKKQLSTMLAIARKGVIDRRLQSSCVELLDQLSSLNTDVWGDKFEIDSDTDSDNCTPSGKMHLDLRCFSCGYKVNQTKHSSKICTVCGHTITGIGFADSNYKCHSAFCNVCIVASSIFVLFTGKFPFKVSLPSDGEAYDIISQNVTPDIVQQVE